MAEFRTLSDADVREILEAFEALGAPSYRSHAAVAAGTINTNVRVETADGPVFLRINEGKTRDDVAREAAIVSHAAARGVPTPAPLRARDGGEAVRRLARRAGVGLPVGAGAHAHARRRHARARRARRRRARAAAPRERGLRRPSTGALRARRDPAPRRGDRDARPRRAHRAGHRPRARARGARARARGDAAPRHHPRRSVHRQRPLRLGRRPGGGGACDRRAAGLRAGLVGSARLRPRRDDARLRVRPRGLSRRRHTRAPRGLRRRARARRRRAPRLRRRGCASPPAASR